MARHSPVPRSAVAAAFAVVLLSPALAWLMWVAPVGESASDARHVLWFVTVAAGCLVAGTLVPRPGWVYAGLCVVSGVSALTTLYLWWSSVDSTGLFMVGVLTATPLVFAAAPLLLMIGGVVAQTARDTRRVA